MKIEILFPEVCNLYGDLANIKFLTKSVPDAEVIETGLKDDLTFLKEDVDLVYLGSGTESGQELVIEKLKPYTDDINKAIENGVRFLVTGNAIEIFGKKISDADGTEIAGLGIFPISTKRDMMKRFNCLYLGKFSDKEVEKPLDIVGFKSQFTESYYDEDVEPLFETSRGSGLNPETTKEGIRKNNFMATYVTGPLLVLNPPFAKWLLKEMGEENPTIAFEKDAMNAYNLRVTEYSDPSTGFYY